MKEKKCKVCSLFDERKFSDEIRFDINKLIKSKEKLEVLNKQTGFNFTNKHYYKVHNDTCLLNFELPIEKQKVLLNQDINKTENSFITSIDIKEIIEDYRNMSIEDKEKSHLKNIDEIKYLIGYITNYNLIHGNNYKGFIIKEDINSLKIINDIVNNINENFKLSFTGKNTQEIFNNSFENFNQGKLNVKQIYDISKLVFIRMKIEKYTQEDKEVSKQMTIEETRAFAKELDLTLQNLKELQEYTEFLEYKKNKNV
jgi:hypothetical protein